MSIPRQTVVTGRCRVLGFYPLGQSAFSLTFRLLPACLYFTRGYLQHRAWRVGGTQSARIVGDSMSHKAEGCLRQRFHVHGLCAAMSMRCAAMYGRSSCRPWFMNGVVGSVGGSGRAAGLLLDRLADTICCG